MRGTLSHSAIARAGAALSNVSPKIAAAKVRHMFMGQILDRPTKAPAGRVRIAITGRSGSGRRTLLATLAELAGRTLATIDAGMLVREKRVPALADLLQHAHLRGWLPCVDGLDTIASDDGATRAAVAELLADHAGPLSVRLPRDAPAPLPPPTAAAAIAGTDRAAFVFMSVALLAVIATAAAIPAQRSEPQPAKTTRRTL